MNDYWVVLLALVSLVAVVGGLLLAAWTRGRLGLASGALFALAVAAWIADFVAVATGIDDADGFVDCGERLHGDASARRTRVHRAAAARRALGSRDGDRALRPCPRPARARVGENRR